MIANELLADVRGCLSSPKPLMDLVGELEKTLCELGWSSQQLALFLTVLPGFELTPQENGDVLVSLANIEVTLDGALANFLVEAKKPLSTDKLVQQLKGFNTSGPQLLAIAKKHPNMNVIGGRAILWK